MSHFRSMKVTHTENTIWNGILPMGKVCGIIIDAEGVRVGVPSSVPPIPGEDSGDAERCFQREAERPSGRQDPLLFPLLDVAEV